MKVLFIASGNSENFEISPFIKVQGQSLLKVGVEIDYFPIKGRGILGYLRAGFDLRNYLKTNQCDLIHAHYSLSGWTAILGARKIPVVLSLMGSDAYGDYIGKNKIRFVSNFIRLLTLFNPTLC